MKHTKGIGWLLVLLLSFMVSCKKSGTLHNVVLNDSLFQLITVDPDDIDQEKRSCISEISDEVKYIPLQSGDSILIGKIKKIIVRDGVYYIWDNLSETIFCFNSEGKFISKICKQGEAPDEYPRISHFTINMENGNIIIYSDMSRCLYEYTKSGKLVKREIVSFILSSLAVKGDQTYCYLGKLPNVDFFKETFPKSYRFLMLKDGHPSCQQLPYEFNECFLKIPLSVNNFSFYNDTLLLTEYLNPEIYSIDFAGTLKPRYRIKFLTNRYTPTFSENVDLERMTRETKQGNLTMLFDGFYETSKYLFFNYSRGLVGMAYVDKRKSTIHNMGYFLLDDFNQNTLPASMNFVDDKYMYKIVDAGQLLMKKEKGKVEFSSYLNSICNGIEEFDNPVIIRIKLK